jgi:hypothetical protein
MPRRQSINAVKMRRLKNADFDVDFFFIGEANYVSLGGGARKSNNDFRWQSESVPTFFWNFLI